MPSAEKKLLADIVQTLLPGSIERRIQDEVVAFVADQIDGMPSYLRYPYRLAMSGFNWLALRPYARTFLKLDPVKQRDYVGMWIHSTIGFKRDFIKLIRSCALLAYYDHPLNRVT
jgi:hypothetical protein